MMKSIHVWWFLASTCKWRAPEARQQNSQVVLAYATVELHKADIYLDRGKLTPEERDLMVSFAVTIQGWSTQRTSMIHLKESEMCRFDQYFSGTFSFARCRSGSACLWWFQRCAAGKSSEWIKSSPSILEVLPLSQEQSVEFLIVPCMKCLLWGSMPVPRFGWTRNAPCLALETPESCCCVVGCKRDSLSHNRSLVPGSNYGLLLAMGATTPKATEAAVGFTWFYDSRW